MSVAPPRSISEMSDAALLERAATGDRAAFDRLAGRYVLRLHRAALRILSNPADAEEVAQEALLRAWQNARRFDPARGSAATWLHRIAVNLAVDRLRATRPTAALAEDLPDTTPDAVAILAQRQRRTALADALAELPARQRAALALTYAEEKPAREAAHLLHTSSRALEGLLHRARRVLRDRLLARDA